MSSLAYLPKSQKGRVFFDPDRIGSFSCDAPTDANITVYDANGVPVCGRRLHNPVGEYVYQLSEYVLKELHLQITGTNLQVYAEWVNDHYRIVNRESVLWAML